MWVIGQRVLSELEPELGLGLVIKISDSRLVEVLFSGAEVTRQYATRSAPLHRLRLKPGQKIQSKKGAVLTISDVKEVNGLLLYLGEGTELWEYELHHVIEDTDALNQFLLGQWSQPRAFDLRVESWRGRAQSLEPELRGLLGARVALLPHQLYIAHQVSQREFPRVLLSDEVGLGKTIEAGLIFAAMRSLGRADRVLILVPDPLKHQWLAEMYRCFHEMFRLVDEETSEQEELSQGKSVFQMNQRVICSLDWLVGEEIALQQAAEEPWDLLIVDEAHHLRWSEEDPSAEWEAVRWLSTRSRGLLLLTATPEFEGVGTLFGLLNLVDPERFAEFDRFQSEIAKIKKTAVLAKPIAAGDRSPAFVQSLEKHVKGDSDLVKTAHAYAEGQDSGPLLRALIDRHGTGRVQIRNRRSRLKGFPGREFYPAPLPAPVAWKEHIEALKPAKVADELLWSIAAGRLTNRSGKASKEAFEVKGNWLVELSKASPAKILLIASRLETVRWLEEWLRHHCTARLGVFHEELEIVERDRQAAWFAQADGAQILLCSEIGGEGRNFQFAHRLVLWDRPLHPDLLEQRIGRLDRIGQKTPVQTYVPYFEDTPEEVLVSWYHDGLTSFTKAWNGGPVWEEMEAKVLEVCRQYLPNAEGFGKRKAKLKTLIKQTHDRVEKIRTEQRESVDVLVDLNSFDEVKGHELVTKADKADRDPALRKYMEGVFDYFGVETEDFDGQGTIKVSAHSLSFIENFPGLSAHGERLVTYDRSHALAREELALLTWDHPMTQGALSLILEGKEGKASGAVWVGGPRELPLLIEMLFVLQVTAPAYLEVERFLPPHRWRVVRGNRGEALITPPRIDPGLLRAIPPKALADRLPDLRGLLGNSVERAMGDVKKEASEVVAKAGAALSTQMQEQLERLRQLSKINPLVSPKEIRQQEEKLRLAIVALQQAVPRLDAIRLIVVA